MHDRTAEYEYYSMTLLRPKPFIIQSGPFTSGTRGLEQRFNSTPGRGFTDDWKPQRKTLVLLDQVGQVLDQYEDHLPLTIRQIYYRLVAVFDYPKLNNDYIRLQELLAKARRARWRLSDGRLLFEAIRDDGFIERLPFFYNDEDDFFERVRRQAEYLRLDRQHGQLRRLALWCEAGGMVPQLERIASQYSVPVFSCGGFDTVTAKYRLGRKWATTGGPRTVLHVGDQDASGVHMFQCLAEDLISFAGPTADIEVVRIAILPSQTGGFEINGRRVPALPPAPPKAADNRRFDRMMIRARSGEDSTFVPIPDQTKTWQAEALDPATLAEIVRAAILQRIDPAVFNARVREEAVVRDGVLDRLDEIMPNKDGDDLP
jgi:hypothetical protein